MSESTPSSRDRTAAPTLGAALRVWMKVGLLSFGGPAGQISLMHRELVERRNWVGDRRFLHALNYCMFLPGPEAQQLAIYLGWLLHRVWGGLLAGLCFVLPGALLIWAIAMVYVYFGDVPALGAVFEGLRPAVVAIVIGALIRLGRKSLHHPLLWALAGLAFVALFFGGLPFPLIILGAGVIGLTAGRWLPGVFLRKEQAGGTDSGRSEQAVIDDGVSAIIARPTAQGTAVAVLLWGAVWLAPVAAAWLLLGGGHVLTQEGFFFSKVSLVTFGGAYAVLPYVAQQAVETHGWLTAAEMMDGLALAETTPGPLILVLQFVGFLGGWSQPGAWPPVVTATAGAVLTSWVIFACGYLFIFAGAPWFEHSRDNRLLMTGLAAVTAAVVGVILNLAVWFGWHTFVPEPGRVDGVALGLAAVCFLLLQWRKWDILPVIALAAVVGLARWAVVAAVG
ncbi:MAG: chromate efflux transporter [Puniceicoccaceae bacterium]|nr:MAG: chromate efflux transporter [Puniceicoccaceae bacterium]